MPQDNVQRVVAFGIVGFVLIVASDFESTGPLATAFAGVILLSTVMLVGPVAFDRVTNLVGTTGTTGPTGGGARRR